MTIFERPQAGILRQRLREPVSKISIVAGPRQVGKTTLVQSALRDFPSSIYIVADPSEEPAASVTASVGDLASAPRDAEWLTRQWQEARARAGRSDKGFVLAIDEIQKIPRWSELVKGLWDADRAAAVPMHVVLLGSSPLLVQKGLTESLAGRYELLRASHWSYAEMQAAFDFNLDEYLYFGGYPGAASGIADKTRWREYVRDSLVAPSIGKDILSLNRVDKPVLLKHLYRLGCDYSGQILAYSKMAPQLADKDDEASETKKSHTGTLAHYLELLMQAGLIAGLQKYSGNRLNLRNSPPKLNVLNMAMMSVESGYGFADAKADRSHWGRVVESAVGAHLYNSGEGECQLYYWRESPLEVDFVLVRGRLLAAIEVKSGKAPSHTQGLEAFARKYPGARKLVVGDGGIPLAEFLSSPASHWL